MNLLITACLICSFLKDDDKLLVTGLFSDAKPEVAREAAYRIYLRPDRKQDELLVHLLTARNELANFCGFPSYAHRLVVAVPKIFSMRFCTNVDDSGTLLHFFMAEHFRVV